MRNAIRLALYFRRPRRRTPLGARYRLLTVVDTCAAVRKVEVEPMLSRRSLLRGATSLVAATPLALALRPGAAHAAPTPSGEVPETLAHRREGLSGGTVVTAPAFPLTHLAVSSSVASAVRLRTPDGWGAWRALSDCAAGPDGASAGGTIVVPATGTTGYEVRIGTGGAADVLELNTVDGPVRASAAPAEPLAFAASTTGTAGARTAALPQFQPLYLSRAAWGADESYRLNPDGTLDTPPTFYGVQTLTVHHTGFDDDQPDPAATVRAIYYNQAVEKDWGDIGYHLMIDSTGRVYEGVYSDEDRLPVFGPERGADGRLQMVNGAHVGGFNAGNIGVCLIGDFTARQPTAAARRSLTVVLALLAAAGRLDPLGTTTYVNPVSGAVASLATISGHRDWNTANPKAGPTLCPGDLFHPTLPVLRRDVARLAGLLNH